MSIFHSRTRKTLGFTLTEAAIVLGIVGLILGAIWVAASAVYNNMRINRTSEQILKIVQNIRSLYAGTHSFDGITNGQDITLDLVPAKVFPNDMVKVEGANTYVYHAWGNSSETSVIARGWLGSPPRFSIEYVGAPQDACMKIITLATGDERDAGIFQAGNQLNSGELVLFTEFPITVTEARTICTTSETPGIMLVYKLN